MNPTILITIAVLFIFLIAFMVLRMSRFIRPVDPVEEINLVEMDAQQAAFHLSEAVKIKTVSSGEAEFDPEPFKMLHQKLKEFYPGLHKTLNLEIVGNATLLYTWQGKNSSLKPVLFVAHQDVVPADPDTLDEWTHEPFSGEISDGFIWGRGTIDIKSQMLAAFEAIEKLLGEGYQPERTIYLAYGEDEEVGGQNGAKQVVKVLQEREVHLAAVLDEGGAIVSGTVPSVDLPVALVGVAEKGHLSLRLRAAGTPGHSSMPHHGTAIGRLARALARLEKHQMPVRYQALTDLFRGLGAAASFSMQFIVANLWLFAPFVKNKLENIPEMNASIRTTTALTIVKGGVKDNVLPNSAEAVVNFRLLPGDTIASVCEHVRKTIDDDLVSFEPLQDGYWEPSPVSSTDNQAFSLLSTTIRQVFEHVVVAPYLVLGATDSRYYPVISDAVYRFSPYQLTGSDLKRMHGIDERLSVEANQKMAVFFYHLIQSWGAEGL